MCPRYKANYVSSDNMMMPFFGGGVTCDSMADNDAILAILKMLSAIKLMWCCNCSDMTGQLAASNKVPEVVF